MEKPARKIFQSIKILANIILDFGTKISKIWRLRAHQQTLLTIPFPIDGYQSKYIHPLIFLIILFSNLKM